MNTITEGRKDDKMFNVGDKVCLAIDNSMVGIVISAISSSEEVTRYQVFHDAMNIAVYFENQLKLIADSQESKNLTLQDFLGVYATKKCELTLTPLCLH